MDSFLVQEVLYREHLKCQNYCKYFVSTMIYFLLIILILLNSGFDKFNELGQPNIDDSKCLIQFARKVCLSENHHTGLEFKLTFPTFDKISDSYGD